MTPRRFDRIKSEKAWRALEETTAAVARYDGQLRAARRGSNVEHQSRMPIVAQPKQPVELNTDE